MYHSFAKTQTIVIKYAIQNQLYRIGVQFERKLIKFDRNEFIKIERCTWFKIGLFWFVAPKFATISSTLVSSLSVYQRNGSDG